MTRDQIATTEAWLPSIPVDWCLAPAKSAFADRREPCRADDVHLTPSQAYGVLPQSLYMETTGHRVVLNLEGQEGMKHVEPDDFIIHLRSFQGGLERSTYTGKVSTAYTVLRPKAGINADFFRWVLKSDGYIQELRTTTNQLRDGQSIKYRDFTKVPLPRPPLNEQRAIADYLDRETAQIDALISKQERLIETLRERRAAVVERVMSGGLDGAFAKPSGLTWTASVPDHWTVANIRRFAQMKTGHTPSRSTPEYWVDCTIPWLTLADVWQLRSGSRTWLAPETNAKISEIGLANSAAELLPAGTVVLSRTASVGFTGIMPVPMATSQDYWNWVCGSNLIPGFLVWTFRAMRKDILGLMIGSTHKTIYQPIAASISIAVPPLDEQRRIVTYLDEQTAKIDALIVKAERFINVSKERRSALITAAVTGQVDVRDRVVSAGAQSLATEPTEQEAQPA